MRRGAFSPPVAKTVFFWMESADQLFPNPRALEKLTDRDPWVSLAGTTRARIALGRAGGSLRTAALLDFRLAHARARDAVSAAFDAKVLEEALVSRGLSVEGLQTEVNERPTYLTRPDLGRRLSDASRNKLRAAADAWGRRDLAILVSDGLSAQAAEQHAAPVLLPLVQQLHAVGWTLYPIFLVPLARVKLQDEVGELLGARHSLILLGERPGLDSPDSLGAYLTFQPGSDRTDANRNCVSNIRMEGLRPEEAARQLAHLLEESARRRLSGTELKV